MPKEVGGELRELDLERELLRAELAARLFGDTQPVCLGRFELVRRLGQGGMGTVYEALDKERGGSVAVKVLSRVDARTIYRLKREFRSLSDVLHPNLVRLHELFCEQGQWFFTMELLQGEPFDRWVRAARERSESSRLFGVLRQLVAAVQAIHAAGKLHRDLKPSNVLVTTEGRVVVLDFGLVGDLGIVGDSHSGSDLAGTPAYLAPEQAAGGGASRASDWYAIGVMLFETLAGCLPFEGNLVRILSDKQSLDAPDPRVLDPGLSPELSGLCVELLRRDPVLRAGGQRILQALGDEPLHDAPDSCSLRSPGQAGFVGRQAELQALQAALHAVRGGTPVSVLLPGRSGMGKSALLERFAALCSDSALVLFGRCYEQESVPFKVFDGVIDALSRYLRKLPAHEVQSLLPRHVRALLQLFPVLGQVPSAVAAAQLRSSPSEPRELRSQAFAALKELLLRLTDRMLVVVVVDDMQWGDVDSARMLRQVLSAPESPALLFVGAYRDDEVHGNEFLSQALADFMVDPDLQPRTIEVGPLSHEIAATLARQLLRAGQIGDESVAETIAIESDGVPFLISELARRFAAAHPGPGPTGARPSLEQVILQRVAHLAQPAERLLQVLSVAAGPLEQSVAIEAAGLARGDWVAMQELRSTRLIRTRVGLCGDLAETYHDRIREILVSSMAPQAIADAHACIARALQSNAVVDPERLVVHYIGAGDRLRAGSTAERAAHAAAQKLAFNRASALFRQAIDLLPQEQHAGLELHRHLGDSLVNSGRGAEAATAYLMAARGLPPQSARTMLRLAAKQYLRSANPQQGVALARSLLHDVGVELSDGRTGTVASWMWQRTRLNLRGLRESHPRRQKPALLERLETIGELAPELGVVDAMTGGSLLARYLREALEAGDPTHVLQGLLWEAFNSALIGGPSNERRAAAIMDSAKALVQRVDTPYARAMLQLAETARLLYTGRRFEDACTAATAAQETFARECKGAFWEHAITANLHVTCLEYVGDMARHARLTAQFQREADERDDTFLAIILTLARALGFVMADDIEGSFAYLKQQSQWVTFSSGTWMLWWFRNVEALMYAGRSRQAVEVVESEWPRFAKSPHFYCEFVRESARYTRARCAVAAYCERTDPALRAHAWKTTRAIQDSATVHGAYRAGMLGALQAAGGDREAALRSLHLSSDRFRSAQCSLASLYPERIIHQLTRNHAGLARVDDEMHRQGIKNPERYNWICIPSSSA